MPGVGGTERRSDPTSGRKAKRSDPLQSPRGGRGGDWGLCWGVSPKALSPSAAERSAMSAPEPLGSIKRISALQGCGRDRPRPPPNSAPSPHPHRSARRRVLRCRGGCATGGGGGDGGTGRPRVGPRWIQTPRGGRRSLCGGPAGSPRPTSALSAPRVGEAETPELRSPPRVGRTGGRCFAALCDGAARPPPPPPQCHSVAAAVARRGRRGPPR